MTQDWKEYEKKLSEQWWNYWNYQGGTPLRDEIEKFWLSKIGSLLKEERIAVLSETNKEISTFWKQGAIIRLEDISTIINNLRVK